MMYLSICSRDGLIKNVTVNFQKKAAGEAISDAGVTVGSSLVSAKEAIHDAAKVRLAELAFRFR